MNIDVVSKQPTEIVELQKKIELDSCVLDDIVDGIISKYSRDLDKYVDYIRQILKEGQPTNTELDDFCMCLPTLIYFASTVSEQLGIRDDISRAIYKEVYHNKRAELTTGTVADKNSLAELESQNEQITNMCYSRAYKTMKAKVESAQELLGSVKKVLSRRMSEAELTRVGGN